MCYDDQARPPLPPTAGSAARGEELVLTAEDGAQFAAYLATPSQPTGAGVIIYPDIRGLHQFYKELALRFAEQGIAAIALDYFGRSAGLTARDDSFEFWPHVQQLRLPTFAQDVRAAQTHLRAQTGAQTPVFVVGFCMGGSLTLLTGTDPTFGFSGLVPFYAGLSRDLGGSGTVLANAARVTYPVLGLFGGADQGIPVTEVQQLDQTLDATGVAHEIVIYPDAPHSFFDRRSAEFADASADAWQRILSFVGGHAAPPRGVPKRRPPRGG